jgi:hypothetical protein
MSGIIGDNVGRSGGLVKSASVSAGLTLVNTSTSSNVSEIDVTSVLDATYPVYMIQMSNMRNYNAGQQTNLRFITSGGTQSSDYGYSRMYHYGTEANQHAATGASTTSLYLNFNPHANAAYGWDGVFWIHNPSGTTFYKNWHGTSFTPADTTAGGSHNANVIYIGGQAWYGGSDAITGFNIVPNAGNIDGVVRTYGLAG